MRPTKALAVSLGLALGMAATFASMSVGLEGCAHVKNFADDAKACFGPDVKGDLGDLVQGVETALVCDLTSGGDALPACVTEGLQTIAQEIGPSGEADVKCVVNKLAQQGAASKPGASPTDVIREQRAKLIVARGGLAMLRSPGNSKPLEAPPPAASPLAAGTLTGESRAGKDGSRDPAGGVFQQAAKSTDEIRAHGETRQPVSMSEGRPALSLRGGPEAGQRAHNPSSPVQFRAPQPFAYTGETPAAALGRCYRACGDNAHGAIAPPGGCECWRHVGSTWRWVATNERTR